MLIFPWKILSVTASLPACLVQGFYVPGHPHTEDRPGAVIISGWVKDHSLGMYWMCWEQAGVTCLYQAPLPPSSCIVVNAQGTAHTGRAGGGNGTRTIGHPTVYIQSLDSQSDAMASQEQSVVVVIVSWEVASGLHFQCFQSSTNPGSVLSFVHIRSMDLPFPSPPVCVSVSGTDRLTANSHYGNLIWLSSAGSNKKKKHWSRNPISIDPSATVEMPSLWTVRTRQYSSPLSICIVHFAA